jgi:hypothetical protein
MGFSLLFHVMSYSVIDSVQLKSLRDVEAESYESQEREGGESSS